MANAENIDSALHDQVKLSLTERQLRNFWAKVDKSPHPKGCWEWTGSRHYKGYGLFGFLRKIHKSHRVSYRISKGEIPDGLLVCHSCDNPPCCNPDHFFLGTNLDNSDDKFRKKRDKVSDAENNGGGGKLTWDDVRNIRAMRITGMSQQSIAIKFGVTQGMIGFIVRNEQWIENKHNVSIRLDKTLGCSVRPVGPSDF